MQRQTVTISSACVRPLIYSIAFVLGILSALSAPAQEIERLPEILNNTRREVQPTTQPGQGASKLIGTKRVEVNPELRTAAGQLDDPNFDAREKATARLTDRNADIHQLYAMLAEGQLTIEQRYRLLSIVRDRLINAPRGAIGVQMEGFPMPGGPAEVRVANLIPGLPAERVLEIGDRIVAVDGQPLNGSEQLINYVQNRQPGEKVTLTVKRAMTNERGDLVLNNENQVMLKTLDVDMTLGSAELLKETSNRFGPQQSMVERTRLMEARSITDNFSPRPRSVNIEGIERMRMDSQAVAPIDPAVEQSWAVQSVLQEQQMIRDGRRMDTVQLREMWKRQLRELMMMAQQPELTPEQRDLLMRIAERYAELVEQPFNERIFPQ